MTRLALRSLRSRWSRTLTAVIGASIAISIAFVLTGIVNGFGSETGRTLAVLGEHYLVPDGALGLITGVTEEAERPPGTMPIAFGRDALLEQNVDVNIFGVEPESVSVVEGRTFEGPYELVIDKSAGVAIGDTLTIAGLDLTIVGLTEGLRIFAGGPVAFLPLSTVQEMYYAKQPLVSAFVSTESVEPTEGLQALSVADAKADIDRAVQGAIGTITMTRSLLWIMVAGILFILNRLNLMDRRAELATLKCLGVGTPAIGFSLLVESMLVGLLGGICGSIAGRLLKPLFPLEIEISTMDVTRILLFTVAASLLAGLFAVAQLRRVVPSDAFRREL